MRLNNDVLKHTVVQINEMQSAMREAAKEIEGSQEYIAKQMEIFRENESLKSAQKMLEKQREQVANSFFGDNQDLKSTLDEIKKIQIPPFNIDASTKKMIDDAVRTSQAIEGYTNVASQELKEAVNQIQKQYNIKVSTQKSSENK